MLPTTVFIRKQQDRITIRMSDTGSRLSEEKEALKALLKAYRSGAIIERQ